MAKENPLVSFEVEIGPGTLRIHSNLHTNRNKGCDSRNKGTTIGIV